MKVICSHVQHCTQPERSECPHSVAHDPGAHMDRICNITPVTCNAGSDGDVICQPIQMTNLVEAMEGLLKVIEDNDIQDESCDDGDGYIDVWRSGGFSWAIEYAQEKLKEAQEEML